MPLSACTTSTRLDDYTSRTRNTHTTPDDASRKQYMHKNRATSPGRDPIVYIYIYLYKYTYIYMHITLIHVQYIKYLHADIVLHAPFFYFSVSVSLSLSLSRSRSHSRSRSRACSGSLVRPSSLSPSLSHARARVLSLPHSFFLFFSLSHPPSLPRALSLCVCTRVCVCTRFG